MSYVPQWAQQPRGQRQWERLPASGPDGALVDCHCGSQVGAAKERLLWMQRWTRGLPPCLTLLLWLHDVPGTLTSPRNTWALRPLHLPMDATKLFMCGPWPGQETPQHSKNLWEATPSGEATGQRLPCRSPQASPHG